GEYLLPVLSEKADRVIDGDSESDAEYQRRTGLERDVEVAHKSGGDHQGEQVWNQRDDDHARIGKEKNHGECYEQACKKQAFLQVGDKELVALDEHLGGSCDECPGGISFTGRHDLVHAGLDDLVHKGVHFYRSDVCDLARDAHL